MTSSSFPSLMLRCRYSRLAMIIPVLRWIDRQMYQVILGLYSVRVKDGCSQLTTSLSPEKMTMYTRSSVRQNTLPRGWKIITARPVNSSKSSSILIPGLELSQFSFRSTKTVLSEPWGQEVPESSDGQGLADINNWSLREKRNCRVSTKISKN